MICSLQLKNKETNQGHDRDMHYRLLPVQERVLVWGLGVLETLKALGGLGCISPLGPG